MCAKWAIFIILGFHIWLINFLPSLSFFSFIGCTDVSLMKKTNTFLTDPAELVCSFPLTGATVINYVLYVVFVLQIITDGMCQKCDLRSCSNVWSGEGQMSTNNIQTKPHQFVGLILYLLSYHIKSAQMDRNSSSFFSSFLFLLQGAGPDFELPAVCGPAVDRYGHRSHSQAEANTWSNNGRLHLHGTGIRVWITDNGRHALKSCSLTSRSGLSLFPFHHI